MIAKERTCMDFLRKILTGALCFVAMFGISTTFSHAQEHIHSIDIQVVLNKDGSADVKQTWDVTGETGSEYYIPLTDLKGVWIEDLRVKDESGRTFDRVKDWTKGGSLEDKAYTCGIVKKGSDTHLCWGKSAYGRHSYVIQYKMINLVKSYSDADGLVSRFVDSGMDLPIDLISLRISYGKEGQRKNLTEENTWLWSFGYAGNSGIRDGVVMVETPTGFISGNHITVILRFEKGLFAPASQAEGSFEDKISHTLNGGDRKSSINGYLDTLWIFMKRIGFPIIAPLLFAVIIYTKRRYEAPLVRQFKRAGGSFRNAEYCRIVPFRGFIDQTSFALMNGGEVVSRKDLMRAYILRMVKEGALVLKKEIDSDFFGGDREHVNFQVNRHTMMEDPCASELFDLIVSAAGKDNILQPGELRNWAMRNAEKIDFWFSTVEIRGEKGFRFREGYYVNRLNTFFGRTRGYVLTERGIEMIRQVLGFKKFLLDFTLIAERETKEIELWDDYLVFAALFGIADRVAEEMKTIYPGFVDVSRLYNLEVDLLSTIYLANSMNEAIQAGYMASSSTAKTFRSGGGSSSLGGGSGSR